MEPELQAHFDAAMNAIRTKAWAARSTVKVTTSVMLPCIHFKDAVSDSPYQAAFRTTVVANREQEGRAAAQTISESAGLKKPDHGTTFRLRKSKYKHLASVGETKSGEFSQKSDVAQAKHSSAQILNYLADANYLCDTRQGFAVVGCGFRRLYVTINEDGTPWIEFELVQDSPLCGKSMTVAELFAELEQRPAMPNVIPYRAPGCYTAADCAEDALIGRLHAFQADGIRRGWAIEKAGICPGGAGGRVGSPANEYKLASDTGGKRGGRLQLNPETIASASTESETFKTQVHKGSAGGDDAMPSRNPPRDRSPPPGGPGGDGKRPPESTQAGPAEKKAKSEKSSQTRDSTPSDQQGKGRQRAAEAGGAGGTESGGAYTAGRTPQEGNSDLERRRQERNLTSQDDSGLESRADKAPLAENRGSSGGAAGRTEEPQSVQKWAEAISLQAGSPPAQHTPSTDSLSSPPAQFEGRLDLAHEAYPVRELDVEASLRALVVGLADRLDRQGFRLRGASPREMDRLRLIVHSS